MNRRLFKVSSAAILVSTSLQAEVLQPLHAGTDQLMMLQSHPLPELEQFQPRLSNIEEASSLLFAESAKVTEDELATQRGGFFTNTGFQIRFGFEQVVVVDGVLHAQTRFSLASEDLARMSNQLDARSQEMENAVAAGKDKMNDSIGTLQTTMESLSQALQDPGVTQGQPEEAVARLDKVTDTLDNTGSALADAVSNASSVVDNGTDSVSQALNDLPNQNGVANAGSGGQITPPSPVSSTTIQIGNQNSVTPTLSNNNNALTTVIQNNLDNKLIQSVQLLNIELSKIGKVSSHSIRGYLQEYLIQGGR